MELTVVACALKTQTAIKGISFLYLRTYRTFPQFLQNRSEEEFNVPQSGQYHLPSGIGSTVKDVWCAFAWV